MLSCAPLLPGENSAAHPRRRLQPRSRCANEGVKGVVLRLSEPAFTEIRVNGNSVRAGTGAEVSAVITQAAGQGLAGLETLIGIPGTVGGALRCNAGDRVGDISQFVRLVEVLDPDGQVQVRERDELRFGYQHSNLDDPVILTAEFPPCG